MIIPNINKTEGNGCSVLVVKIITRARNFLPSGGMIYILNENISYDTSVSIYTTH